MMQSQDRQEQITPSALDVVSEYTAALMAQDSERMNTFHAPDFVLDWVYGDAYEDSLSSAEEAHEIWPSWFAGFPEMAYQVVRTIAAEEVVVSQWIFSGTNSGPLGPPTFETLREPTGKTIRFRGVSIYDVSEGLIQRETLYMDLATILVELGIDV